MHDMLKQLAQEGGFDRFPFSLQPSSPVTMTQRQYRQSPIIIAAVCVSGAAATVSVWRRIRRNSKKKAESRSSAAAAAAAAATGMEALLLSTTPVHKVYLFTFPPVPRVRK
mmetsp:Transcript_31317/g.69371  ORF Transcript_31317/g.69371 Transcript_31317/m.69371 type:complete len:111 (+) Transcript_31317:48-380(+)